MEEKMEDKFGLISTQRYYHCVPYMVKEDTFSQQSFWNSLELLFPLNSRNPERFSAPNYSVYHKSCFTIEPYVSTDDGNSFKVEIHDEIYYQYDIFLVELKVLPIFIMLFPLKKVGTDVFERLIGFEKILAKGRFMKPKLEKFIRENEKSNKLTTDDFEGMMTSMNLILNEEPGLSSLSLGGENPLTSNFFKKFVSNSLHLKHANVDGISISGKVLENSKLGIPKTFSVVHLDIFGNMKMYLHKNGYNVLTLPYVVDSFSKLESWELTLANPLERIRDKDSER